MMLTLTGAALVKGINVMCVIYAGCRWAGNNYTDIFLCKLAEGTRERMWTNNLLIIGCTGFPNHLCFFTWLKDTRKSIYKDSNEKVSILTHHECPTSSSGLITKMQIKSSNKGCGLKSFLPAVLFKEWTCNLLLIWRSVLLSLRFFWGAGVMWGKPSAILSTLLASPFSVICTSHTQLPFFVFSFSPSCSLARLQIAPLTILPHYFFSLLECPCLFYPFHPNPHIFLFFFHLHHTTPIFFLLPTSLFRFPVISSLFHRRHLCSLDQYSVPASCH